jgi:hypothetical protein
MPDVLTTPVAPDKGTSETREPENRPADAAQVVATGRIHRGSKRTRRARFVGTAALGVAAIIGMVIAVADRGPDGRRQGEVTTAVRRYEAVLEQHDWPALARLLAAEFSFHNLDSGSLQDRHGFLAWAQLIGDTSPGFAVGVDDVRLDGKVAVARFHEGRSDGHAVDRRSACGAVS